MFKLQFLLAWRNLVKRKFYSSIEIIGLAVGIACFFIILLHVKKEFSFDKFFHEYQNIYRVLNLEKGTGNRYSGGASAIGHHAKTEIPQVTDVVRVFFPYKMYSTSALVQCGDVIFYEENIAEADSNFFGMFDFKFVEGDKLTALQHPDAIVLSDRAAKKLFGNDSALGKLISIDDDLALQVSAVVHVPDNTHLKFDYLRPAHHDPSQLYVWEHTLAFTYFKIDNADDVPKVEKQLYDIVLKHSTANQDAAYLKGYFHQLQPLSDVHTTVIQWDIVQATPTKQLWAILGIAVFILLLAVVNFINLATARAAERMKETGISKILGASKQRLIVQFFVEFIMVTVVAGVFALILLMAFIEAFNTAMGTALQITELQHSTGVLIFITVLIATAVLSGIYPAFTLSSFKPVNVIKRTLTNTSGRNLRHALVVFQFVISIGLLSGTLIIQKQINYMQTADLGFDKEQIYILRLREADPNRFGQLKQSLSKHPQIIKIAGASALLGGEPGSDTFHPDHMPDPTPETFAKNIAVDPEFLELIDVPLLAGRNFQHDNPQDYRRAYVVNETAVKQFQLKDPIDVNFKRSGDVTGKVIGVMKDFHFAKMNERINPMVFFLDSISSYRYMFIKLHGDIPSAVSSIEDSWSEIMPEFPIEGFFMDQYFNSLYEQEQQVAKITSWFSALAIALASLGLLGMSSFVILQRTKEIGIRKVVGASVKDVLMLLCSGFLKPIGIAFVISIPVTIYLLNGWLESFASRISINAGFFIMAGTITVFTALITISVQSVRAALANPVDSLKQE